MHSFILSTALASLSMAGLAAAYSRETFNAAMLNGHNAFRATHSDTGPLAWDEGLAGEATSWAENCFFGHKGSGENLYVQTAGAEGPKDPLDALVSWGPREEGLYSPGDTFSMGAGHYTQMVWRGTTKLGCGLAMCGSQVPTSDGPMFPNRPYPGQNVWYVVCRYDPPGNMNTRQAFNANIGQRISGQRGQMPPVETAPTFGTPVRTPIIEEPAPAPVLGGGEDESAGGGEEVAAPGPVVEEPAPVVEEPVVEEPAPVIEEPVREVIPPVDNERGSEGEEGAAPAPAPVSSAPAPILSTPARPSSALPVLPSGCTTRVIVTVITETATVTATTPLTTARPLETAPPALSAAKPTPVPSEKPCEKRSRLHRRAHGGI